MADTPEYEDDGIESELDCYQRELAEHERAKQRTEAELRAAAFRASDRGALYRSVEKLWDDVQALLRER